ncbi:MAG: hypothetical protein ACRESZ_07135 [Methylococcales bacterium]
MAYRQEKSIADIVKQSGVLGGRGPWYPEHEQNQTRFARGGLDN